MDFNALLRQHLYGEEQGVFRPPSAEAYPGNDQAGSAFGMMIGTGWEGGQVGPAVSDECEHKSSGIEPNIDLDEDYSSSDSGLSHVWDVAPQGDGRGPHHATPSPPNMASPSNVSAPDTGSNTSPALLHAHRDAIFQSSWFINNQVEPPIQPSDPLVRLGLLTPESSRFDLFIHSNNDKHNCLFVAPGTTATCSYSNFRRQRVKVHVLAHFSYKPFVCDGSCGKSDCTLGFADSVLLGDHIRRVAKPRAQCEICGAMIAPQNYRRHQTLMHSGHQG